MYLELTEALDCPVCRSGFGLVAFVGDARGRRVIRGGLGCPLCEGEAPIEGGTVDFASFDPEAERPAVSRLESEPEDLPIRLASLLGVAERRGIVVSVGPGLGRYGPEVARLAERAEVIAWVDGKDEARDFALSDLEAGFDPVRGARPASWPVRSAFLDGAALGPDAGTHLDEAARCLKPGGRLVIISCDAARPGASEDAPFRELARDETTWVGERR